ncbi:MAG: exopolyphosphatase [Proteobacteria bacterium]|nr:exopolyphosphatase [Pseudomonadota bacterium]
MTDTPLCRLVTRSDFDGLVCAVLLKERGLIDRIEFVHPKDMQDGKIAMGPDDISTNLPYVPGCRLAFDHHASEMTRVAGHPDNHIIDPKAASAARVVYDYYGGAAAFPNVSVEMMAAVDKADSAQFSLDEILNPTGWVLLSFLMDARTGLGRFRDFRVSNYQLMMELIDYCRDHTIEQILALPDVAERADLYAAHRDKARAQLRRTAAVYGKLVILDLRNEDPIYATNRFTLYALFPQVTVSIHAIWGVKKQNTAFAIGKSIIDRSSRLDIGALCLRYGGGGHEAAGTCQVANEDAERVLGELMAQIEASS